jgi:serine/threonine protein kinase
MTDNIINKCLNCFANKQAAKQCPSCGYEETLDEPNPLYIKPRTILNQRYLIGNVIGHGGFGITYLSWDLKLKRKVAMKEFLPTNLATRIEKIDGENTRYTVTHTGNQEQAFQIGLKKFLKEARILAEFANENIVRVIDYFESYNTGYIVMEYVGEQDLSQLIKQYPDKRFPVEQALEIFFLILNALKVIHANGIYHQDISLQNIRMVEGKKPVLIDFGAARFIVGELSQSLDRIFKPGYSPVEQITSSGKIGAWTDIYACGAVLYAMIVGELPPHSVDRLDKDDLIPPIEKGVKISDSVNNAILKALSVRIGDRFQTVEEFEQALQDKNIIIHDKSISKEKSNKKPLLAAIGGIFFVAILVASLYNPNTKKPERPVINTGFQTQTGTSESSSNSSSYDNDQASRLQDQRATREMEARLAAAEQARKKAEMEAKIAQAEQARLKAEQEAQLARDAQARLKTEQYAIRRRAEEEARREAERHRQEQARREAEKRSQEQAPAQVVRSYYEAINSNNASLAISIWNSPTQKKRRSIRKLTKGVDWFRVNEIKMISISGNYATVSVDVTGKQRGKSAEERWAGTVELENVWGNWKVTKLNLSQN